MALYLKKELENNAVLAVWRIDETEEELRSLSSIPSDELEEISYISNESMRKQRLAIRVLLSHLFDEKVYLSHHENNKPYLENMAINISITHTDKYVAIILHDEEEVGIDIESLDRDFSVVEQKALSEEEIEDLGNEYRNTQLAIYWCTKEAIFKRVSGYRVDFAEQIEVARFIPKEEGKLDARFFYKDDTSEHFSLNYMIFDRHVLVWLVG